MAQLGLIRLCIAHRLDHRDCRLTGVAFSAVSEAKTMILGGAFGIVLCLPILAHSER